MMQAVRNNLIVTVKTKYVKNYTSILKQAQLVNQTEFNAADLVNIVGEVISVPKHIDDTEEYAGFSAEGIFPGDTIIFRYDVIYAFAREKEVDAPIYRNLFWYKGQEYWTVDIQKVFAVIRNGEIIMKNGYVMIENIEMPSTLIIPGELKKLLSVGTATVTNIGDNRTNQNKLWIDQFSTVYLNPRIIQRYQINNHFFGIVEQRHIFGSTPPIYLEN